MAFVHCLHHPEGYRDPAAAAQRPRSLLLQPSAGQSALSARETQRQGRLVYAQCVHAAVFLKAKVSLATYGARISHTVQSFLWVQTSVSALLSGGQVLVTFYSGSAVLDYNDSISKELTIDRQTEILGMGAILYLTKKDLHHSFSHSLAVQR